MSANPKQSLRNVTLGKECDKFSILLIMYDCEIGDNSKIGTFVEVQKRSKNWQECKSLDTYLHL